MCIAKNEREWICPERLQMGDTIGFVAPCCVLQKKDADQARSVLEGMGFRVKYAEHLFSKAWGFSGTDRERTEDFMQMIEDPEVKMLLFTGGEVSTHLLPLLDYESIRRHPKLISSFSDGTSILNAIACRSGLMTFYGQSIRTFAEHTEGTGYNLQTFQDRLVKGTAEYKAASSWRTLCSGQAEGRLTGGYLVNFTLLQNTPYYQWNSEERPLLFLEDHEKFNEPAAVSRYLSCLEQDGVFDKVCGLIFGHYSEQHCPILDEILLRIGQKHNIPVVRTDDFGHGKYNAIFPIGEYAMLDTECGSFELRGSSVY